MEGVIGVFIPIVLFIVIFGILYVYFTTRNKERLLLIEKGADASMFKTERRPAQVLKFGMLCVGVAVGILMGHFVSAHTGLDEHIAHISMVFLFGGLSLILFYLIERKMKKENGKSND